MAVQRKSARNLKISDVGIALLKRWEGLRLRAYADVGGKMTIGYGHLMKPGEPKVITEAEAERLLRLDLATAETAVRTGVAVGLWQCEYDALVSLVYNIGAGAFAHSTLRARLNAGDYRQASIQFTVWNKVNGKTVQGLVNRRKDERRLFDSIPV